MKSFRMRRIFASDGRSLILALDRPRALLTPSLSEPWSVAGLCVSAGVDAVIAPLGTLRGSSEVIGDAGTILSVRELLDGPQPVIDAVLRLGLDGIKFEAFPGGPHEDRTMKHLEALGRTCDEYGVPLMAEMIPHSFENREMHTADHVAHAARMAMECGADIVKVPPPSSGTFEQIVSYAAVPVVFLGGPLTSVEQMLELCRSAVAAGASGLTVGRNVFDSSDPVSTVRHLLSAIHAGTPRSSSPPAL